MYIRLLILNPSLMYCVCNLFSFLLNFYLFIMVIIWIMLRSAHENPGRPPTVPTVDRSPWDAITGCAPPPRVGVERRRAILLIVASPLRNDHDLVVTGHFPLDLQVQPQSGATERQLAGYLCVASLPHHLGGGDAPGGWGRSRGLGPPGSPSGTRGGPPRGPHEATSLSYNSSETAQKVTG